MKSKILLFLSMMAAGIVSIAQPANWREDSPSNFIPITVKSETQKVTEGSKAVKITFTETGTPYYVSDTFNVTGGAAFNFSIDILDNDPGAEVNQRIRFVLADGSGTNATSSEYSADAAGYKTYTYTGTAPATAVKAYIIIRIYDVPAAWKGSGTFWLDNAKYTEGSGTTNLIPNGGFEKWITPAGSTLANWSEDSPSTFVPITIQSENQSVTEGNSAVKISFTETGTPYFVSDTFNVTGGAAFSFSIDILDNDPGAEVNQRIRFVLADGSGTNATSSEYSVNNAGYKTYTFTGTAPATAVKAYIIIRIYDVPDAWKGSGTFWLDNAKYTEGSGTTNLIPNGGFEKWNIPAGSTPANWTESLYDASKTSVITQETEKVSEGSTSVKYTFTDPGTPYFLSDTFNVTAGAEYKFSIDYLDNDPAGLISARLWFHESPGTPYLNRYTTGNTVDSPEWQTLSLSGTVPANAKLAVVAIRMNVANASTFTSATFHADNAKFTEGSGTANLIVNGSFEDWDIPAATDFVSYKFSGLTPEVVGVINNSAKTITAQVPYSTDVTGLVATFTVSDGAIAKVAGVEQVSGTTPNNFTSPVIYNISKGTQTQNWTVTVTKPAPTSGKDILSFNFNGLTPPVTGVVNTSGKTVSLQVPTGTNVTALVPAITLSPNATVSPLSGVAQNFSAPVTYTVTAQDGTTQAWVVTVTTAPAGQTTIFFEDFEKLTTLPSGWIIINNDKYIQAAGEERWQDSAWVVATSNRIELVGTKVAMASSFTSNMPMNGRADDWMILPAIELGSNSTLSWQAMSTTSSGNYPDDYRVYIAPVTEGVTPDIAYFEENANLLISIAPENWSTGVGRPGAGLANRSINLKQKVTPDAPNGWFDRKVWIAFVLTTDLYTNPTTGIPNSAPGGSNLAIDNIKVVNDISTGIGKIGNDFKTKIYPNPAKSEFFIDLDSPINETATIRVLDITGREVMLVNENVNIGFNRININVTGLKRGIYLVKTEIDKKINLTKLILND
jgi:hypothetical protein